MNTAVVINAGLGSLTMGIEKAGYQVIAAYETDPKARSVHERNINAPIFDRIPTRKEYGAWEEPDLLAARRVEEARKARAERIERQRYEEPIGDAPEPAEESIDDFEDSGERKPKKQSNKKGTKKQGKKNVELPGDDFEDLG